MSESKVVPVEANAEMNFAGYDACGKHSTVKIGLSTISKIYAAMIEAAPTAAPTDTGLVDVEAIMSLVDEYADAFVDAGGGTDKIGFAEGLVANAKKNAIRNALAALRRPQSQVAAEAGEREAFERLHCGNNKHTTRKNSTTGDYVLPSVQDAWAGWQSHSALLGGEADINAMRTTREPK